MNFLIPAALAAVAIPTAAVFLRFQNNSIVVSELTYSSGKVPEQFNNFKLVQISDLHNKMFSPDQKPLIDAVRRSSPDAVVITGDLIDKRRTDKNDIFKAFALIDKLVELSDVYYAPGNHESISPVYDKLRDHLLSCGVNVLENGAAVLERGGGSIIITGVKDISFIESTDMEKQKAEFEGVLTSLKHSSPDALNILLSHRPDLTDIYSRCGYDLVLSGHAHGGQFRLPFIGGLYAPHQGILPKITSGIYRKNNTDIIVSRGLGNSLFPIRLFNRPEIVLITLKKANM